MTQFDDHVNRVLSVGVDYLTGTIKPGYHCAIVASAAEAYQRERAAEGYKLTPWQWKGYAGVSVDGITYGGRNDGYIVRLSGDVAERRAVSFLPWLDTITRVDVQVTLVDERLGFDWPAVALAMAKRDKRVESGMTKTLITRGTPNGVTLNVGSRSSDRYYRLYDKHAESDGVYPPGSWRWEVEYKENRAQMVAKHLRSANCDAEAVRGVVERAFGDYGITLPCRPLLPTWEDARPREKTDDQRRLEWLEKGVRPMLARMQEGIPVTRLLEALGLDDILPWSSDSLR